MRESLDEWVQALCAAIAAGSLSATQEAADGLRCWLLSEPAQVDGLVLGLGALNRVGKSLAQAGAEGGRRALPPIEALVLAPEPDLRTLSCYALAGVGSVEPVLIEPLVRRLAGDPNWAVREIIANALDDYVGPTQGEALFAIMEALAIDPDENVRRLPTNALMRYGRAHPDRVIRLMARLRCDPSEYVRKNVVFCLGVMGLAKHPTLGYPDPAGPSRLLGYLADWAQDENPQSRWVIAETLARKWTRGNEVAAGALLSCLDSDERPMIRRAVARARKEIEKRGRP